MPIIDAFDRQDAKSLPPHKKGVDHEINLVEGKTNDDIPTITTTKTVSKRTECQLETVDCMC